MVPPINNHTFFLRCLCLPRHDVSARLACRAVAVRGILVACFSRYCTFFFFCFWRKKAVESNGCVREIPTSRACLGSAPIYSPVFVLRQSHHATSRFCTRLLLGGRRPWNENPNLAWQLHASTLVVQSAHKVGAAATRQATYKLKPRVPTPVLSSTPHSRWKALLFVGTIVHSNHRLVGTEKITLKSGVAVACRQKWLRHFRPMKLQDAQFSFRGLSRHHLPFLLGRCCCCCCQIPPPTCMQTMVCRRLGLLFFLPVCVLLVDNFGVDVLSSAPIHHRNHQQQKLVLLSLQPTKITSFILQQSREIIIFYTYYTFFSRTTANNKKKLV